MNVQPEQAVVSLGLAFLFGLLSGLAVAYSLQPRLPADAHAYATPPASPVIPLPHEEPCQAWCRVHGGGADCLARMEFKDARRPAGSPSVCR